MKISVLWNGPSAESFHDISELLDIITDDFTAIITDADTGEFIYGPECEESLEGMNDIDGESAIYWKDPNTGRAWSWTESDGLRTWKNIDNAVFHLLHAGFTW